MSTYPPSLIECLKDFKAALENVGRAYYYFTSREFQMFVVSRYQTEHKYADLAICSVRTLGTFLTDRSLHEHTGLIYAGHKASQRQYTFDQNWEEATKKD